MADSANTTSNTSNSSDSVQFVEERPGNGQPDVGGNGHGQPRACICQMPPPPPGFVRAGPFLGPSVPTNVNTIEIGFSVHPTHPINTAMWETISSNLSTHSSSTPFSLAGRGIQGVLHGTLHRYVTTQMVYCLCGCLCGTLILKIREDFDVANYFESPFNAFDPMMELQIQSRNRYQLQDDGSQQLLNFRHAPH